MGICSTKPSIPTFESLPVVPDSLQTKPVATKDQCTQTPITLNEALKTIDDCESPRLSKLLDLAPLLSSASYADLLDKIDGLQPKSKTTGEQTQQGTQTSDLCQSSIDENPKLSYESDSGLGNTKPLQTKPLRFFLPEDLKS